MAESEARVKALVARVYEARRDRRVNPEGTFDHAGRWYPSAREDVGGEIRRTHRSPSRAWPYSLMAAARAKRHCRTLVEAGLSGADVPDDVKAALADVPDERQGHTHLP